MKDFLAKSKKAIAGGIAGAVTAAGTAIATAFADGAFDQADAWIVASAVVGGFLVAAATVYAAPANATGETTSDAPQG
jgi:hypothetical protein